MFMFVYFCLFVFMFVVCCFVVSFLHFLMHGFFIIFICFILKQINEIGAPSVSEMINHAPEKVATMENQSVVNEDEKMNAQRMREYLNRMSQGFQPVISSGLYGPEV